jgi:DNA polymerase-3 subunit delta
VTPGELARELAAGRLRPAYLLLGEEALLREDALAQLRDAALADGPRDFDHDRLDGESTSPGALEDAVRALPVLAPRRLVELREPDARRGGALADALAALLPELLERTETVLVVSASRADRRARWVKAFRDPAAVVACDAPRGARALLEFLRQEARRQGVALEPAAAEALVEAVGPQLLVLRRELEKLALLAGEGARVTRAHVAAAASATADEPVWELTDAIGEGRAADALVALRRLLGGGTPAPVLLGALASHFRKLARTRAGAPAPGHPFAVRKLESQAQRYAPTRLLACLRAIHEVDEVLKGQGALRSDVALERLVMGLAG